MRKISRLNYFRIMLCILMFMPLMVSGQTVSPRSGSTVEELSEIKITFSSNVVLQNIDGISIGLGNQYLPPWDKPGEYGFSVTTQGNQATIKLDKPFSNLYNFEQWGSFLCEEGTFLVGGSPSGTISAEWTFSPSKATIPEPVIYPARGSMNLSLSEFTIEWPGCGVEIVGNEWDLEEVKFGIRGSNYSNANIASIETSGNAGNLGSSKVVIKVQNSKDGNKPFTEKGTYILNLEQGVVKINATDGSAMYPGDEFTFYISDYMVSPKNMSKITTFDGLTIGGGNIEVSDPSSIKLYLGYYDGTGESVPPADLSPLASGTNVTETTLDGFPGMNVSFNLNEPLYNGAYTIYVPANVIKSDGKGINEGNSLYVTFTVEGNLKPLPEWTAEPAPGKVTSLSTVKVAWDKKRAASNALEDFYGDFLTLKENTGYVPVTLQLPNGSKNNLMGTVRIVTDDNGDVDQAEKLGAYLYIMMGNSYSADGTYTLTIPAGAFTVDVDNHNHVPVENTVITYTIGDGTSTDPLPEAKDIRIAFATEGTDIGSNTISSRTDPLLERQSDGSYTYEYALNSKNTKNFGFMLYYEEGYNATSIGKASREGSSYGANEQITLPDVPGEQAEYTFTDLGLYTVGFAGYGMQSTFTFTNPGGFIEGSAKLKLSADFKTLEVSVTSNEVVEPEPAEGSLKLEDENFYPQPNVPYYYTPTQDGILTIKAMEGGSFTITSMSGGLFSSDGKPVSPAKTDGEISDEYIFDFSYVDYELKAGNQYYFKWGKNSDGDEYALYAQFGQGTAGPQIPDPIVNPANNSKVDKLETVTLRWNGYEVYQIGDGEGGTLKDITYAINGGTPKVINAEYQGAESNAFEGYYPTLALPINAKESGKYEITIPAGALFIANEDKGSLVVDKDIMLTYDVTLTETPPAVLMTGATIDPRDGSLMDNMGNVMIAWTQYRLAIEPVPGQDFVDLPLDGVHIYINGEENTNWINGMGASLRAVNTKGSNEGGGGPASEYDVAEILLCPGDPAFWWEGTVNIVLPEGLVKSTSGAVSPAFNLTYYVGGNEVVSPAIFTPTEGTKFIPGEAVVYAEWTGYSVTGINGGVTLNTINEEGDVSDSENISNSQLSIENGKLKIDLTSLPESTYQMWLHQGAVNLGDNAINADAPYAFTIAAPEPEAPEATDIDPDINFSDGKIIISWEGNEINLTDDFNLTIIDNTNGEEVDIPEGAVSVDENGNLIIDLGEISLSDGDYTLTLAEGSVNIDEDGIITYNNEVSYNFKTSAIGMFTVDGTGYWRVFNLNGVNILNTDNAADLNRLEPGIYIINGKKIVKR